MRIRLALLLLVTLSSTALCAQDRELRFAMKADPKTFDPLLVEDQPSENIRYITGGFLVRINRKTQQFEPELAKSWRVSAQGRTLTFQLREHVQFSDGSNFSSSDVVATLNRVLDPATHSSVGDTLRTGGDAKVRALNANSVQITFEKPIANVVRLFDNIAIMPASYKGREQVVLGPFQVAEVKAGSYILLKRNPYYWKRDAQGKRLPYLDAVRVVIQRNPEAEYLAFRRSELDLINTLPPDLYERLKRDDPSSARDLGSSVESEEFWFNQRPGSPMPDYKLHWFQSQQFRKAVSLAIDRDDMVRLVLRGHGKPSVGPITAANQFWYDSKLHADAHDPKRALALLQQVGFRLDGSQLKDSAGHPVEFSVITNAGNKPREQMATLMQQDLSQIGIKLNVVTLDFGSLIDRITHSFDYESCLLGLTSVELDPDGQMNVWLSSGENHQWNPMEKTPATPWEAEIDKLMEKQAASMDPKQRKAAFDRVQEIINEEVPFLYLVDKDALAAVSPKVVNADPVSIRPQTFWNIEYLNVR